MVKRLNNPTQLIMKTSLLTLTLMLFSIPLFCQEEENIIDTFYITDLDIIVEEFKMSDEPDINKNIIPEKFYALKGNRFTAFQIIDGKRLIKFKSHYLADVIVPPISGFPPSPITIPAITIDTNDKYFVMRLVDFEKRASEYNGSMDIDSKY